MSTKQDNLGQNVKLVVRDPKERLAEIQILSCKSCWLIEWSPDDSILSQLNIF